MCKTTRAQRESLLRLFKRLESGTMTYREFRKQATPAFSCGAIAVPFCGMYVCIETDGYSHS